MIDDEILKAKIAKEKKCKQDYDNEERMRVLANLIIDRVLEDKRKRKLRFTKT